jgi:hypothetical protein
LISPSTTVSPSSQRRAESFGLETVKHELLLGPGYEKFLAQSPQKLVLESIQRKLNRYAKSLLTRKRRQELLQLLQELEVPGREIPEAEDLLQTLKSARESLRKQDQTLDVVAKALLESGSLGEARIQKAEQSHAEKYVQERTAALQAQIDAAITAKREELRKVET